MRRILLGTVAALLALSLSPAQAASHIVATGTGNSTDGCSNYTVTIVGTNVSGNTWTFEFDGASTTCSGTLKAKAHVGAATGTWSPASGGCVSGGTNLNGFCLGVVPAGTETGVTFSASFALPMDTVNGTATTVRA